MRLIDSMAWWYSDALTSRFCEHVGQSGHPSPEFVNRTAPPVTMMNASAMVATNVILRYAAGDRSCNRISVDRRTLFTKRLAHHRAGYASDVIPDRTDDAPEELTDELAEKDAQVLQREPMETELMDDDESAAGEDVEGVEDGA